MGKIIAAYGGGFKPPTSGHFEVVKKALDEFPEIEEFIIYVGGGEREGINQAQSILIWEIYQTYLPMKVKILPSKAPIGDIIRLGKNNLQDEVYFVIGTRDGSEDDMKDLSTRTSNIEEKYPNMEIKVINTPNKDISGTNARKASQVSYEDFTKYIPSELSNSEKEEVYDIVKPPIKETDNPEDGKSSPFGSGYKKLNENASYSKDIDVKGKIMQLTQHMLDKGYNIEPLPKVEFVDGDSDNAREFLGKTAYYNPSNQTITLYTEGRHPKDIVRSFTHEMIHHIQNLEGRLGNITTTNTQEDDNLNDIEAEANLKGTMTFRNWTDSLNEAIVGDKIECDNCDWSWNIVDGGDDLFICHKCGHDNTPLNEANKPYKHKSGFNGKLGKDPFGLNQYARELATETYQEIVMEGKYDTITNKLSKIAFEAFKNIHDKGNKKGTFKFSVGPFEEDIFSDQFEFDFEGYIEITDNEYNVDGGSNAGFDISGDEVTPELLVKFKIPKNPDWQEVSFDIKDVVRHELEHLTQDGENERSGKYLKDDQFFRDLIKKGLLAPKRYFTLDKEIDAMLQGLYFKAKKSKRPFKDVINNYLDIFISNGKITKEEKENILDVWRSRREALSLPLFEQTEDNMKYTIYSDMDGVLTDFEASFMKISDGIMPAEYQKNFGKNGFWKLIDKAGIDYWVGMPWMPDGKTYWDYIKGYNPILLSSPSMSNTSRLGKGLWVEDNLPGTKLILSQAKDKQNYACKDCILIDDRPSNIDQWRSQGGIGILHTSASDTIRQLKELGL